MNCDAFLLLAESSTRSIFGMSDPFPDLTGSSPRLLVHMLLCLGGGLLKSTLSTGRRILRAENLSYVDVEPNVELSTFISLRLSSVYTHRPVTQENMDKRELRIARGYLPACEADRLYSFDTAPVPSDDTRVDDQLFPPPYEATASTSFGTASAAPAPTPNGAVRAVEKIAPGTKLQDRECEL